ncbi:MAG: hyalin, partial [Actinomycetota bacterium]|nr:hyalin [Actinomycetota bacterium]
MGNTAFFQAIDRSHGRELWRTDGTEAGTELVKDVNPGPAGSTDPSPRPPHLAELDGVLYFVASDGVHGDELWRSDGTEAGTELVADVRPGSSGSLIPDSSHYGAITAVGDTLYFTASDGVGGRELWRSDGTAAGTRLVEDINPGSDASWPIILVAVNNVLYFTADDGVHGKELWRSDGTAAGTELV